MVAILLCISSPRILRVLRTQPDKKIMEMGSSGPQHLSITDKFALASLYRTKSTFDRIAIVALLSDLTHPWIASVPKMLDLV